MFKLICIALGSLSFKDIKPKPQTVQPSALFGSKNAVQALPTDVDLQDGKLTVRGAAYACRCHFCQRQLERAWM
jgi:hypothetical protein